MKFLFLILTGLFFTSHKIIAKKCFLLNRLFLCFFTCYKGTLTTFKPSGLKSLANIIAAAAAAEAWTAAASSSSVVVFLQ
jgi:hypothetical protein